MRNLSWVGLVGAALMACACAGGGSKSAAAPSQSPAGGYGAPSGEPSSPAESADMSASPQAAPAGAGAYEGKKAEAESRPGLGTEWGENRDSRVSTSPFIRENQGSPFSIVKMFYNDRDGVRAMARSAGISDFHDGSARSAHNALTVRLLDSNNRPLEGFSSSGNTYVIGDAGDRYTIEIRNNTGARFEAVATVDGLDVISGRHGTFANRGYIVNPWSTVEIDGWRRSADTVAAFRFGRVSQSYAAKKGEDRNVGVIGVAFFEERGATYPWTQREIDRRHNADPFPGQYAEPPTPNY